eukprot:TRINITY_DN1682_c0_g1_i1.p1 TRINITY_DN1682_c0_g1~~TRINITY_DN1682_c0_g1_i1.p1  ORF type:complete len:844 (-),score=166.73 TRINITY_DN1682_c0_g1_i1:574-3105(-)
MKRSLLLSSLVLFGGLVITGSHAQCEYDPCGVNTICDDSRSGAAVCRCRPGYDHSPGGNTIDGCPIRIGSSSGSSGGSRRAPSPRPVSFPTRRQHSSLSSSGFNRRPLRTRNNNAVGFLGNPCSPNPCGTDARCEPVGERPLCTCPESYSGDPYTRCEPDPCDVTRCGINAECESQGNRAVCKCPPGFEGDPYNRCNDNPCNASPCGTNADCTNNGGRASCKCRPNYEGDPYSQCSLDPCLISPCGINADCQKSPGRSASRAICKCRPGYEGDPFARCNLDPCHDSPCGANAECSARSSSAVCKCIEGYTGDPFSNCELDPCSNSPCGQNAECESRGRSSICSCPRGFSGDPYSNCREDPCANNPCGTDAECTNSGNRPNCRCPQGYVGDPHIACSLDPCSDRDACGLNTECEASGTRSICRCRSGYSGSPYGRSGCRSDPCSAVDICGLNAECRNQGDRPVCECLPNHKGDPYTQCFRGDCVSNSECSTNQACKDYVCVDPCLDSCSPNADCQVQNHVAICRCPKGYTGDPFSNCRRFTREEICAACGANTDCEVSRDDQPICKCKQNYIGNPITGCRYECERDGDCSSSQHQCVNKRCVPACRDGVCGESANCQARSHKPICSCPENFLGDAYSRCYTECVNHSECSDNKACVAFKCKDPCFEPDPNVCGLGADCEAKGHKAICSCPRGFTGDPFVSCREFSKKDLCEPNPCGDGATCNPGTDRSGNDRPVCTCSPGYRGDPLIRCVRGECENDSECPSNMACYDFNCKDPCVDACGLNAECRALNHGAICSCRSGYVGNPLESCRESQSNSRIFNQHSNNNDRRHGNRGKRDLFSQLFAH